MKIKTEVILQGLQIEMRKVLKIADEEYKKVGQELVITSALDGVHSAGSYHPFGYAIDIRTNFFIEEEKQLMAERLRERLGGDYDVVVESTHIHIEYDYDRARSNKNG